MAWNIEKNQITGQMELVINGFEKGIADSPYEGIADMRNVNITTSPKEAAVNFKTTGVTLPPTGFTAVAFSSDSATGKFTVADTTGFYTGMALTIVTVSGAGSGTAGTTYYVGDITATTFKLYEYMDVGIGLSVTNSRTGTFTVPTFGTPSDSVSAPSNTFDSSTGLNYKFTFLLTTDGYAWRLTALPSTSTGGTVAKNSLQFLGNLLHSTATNRALGIAVWHQYLFVFMDTKIDYIAITNITNGNPASNWHYAWQTTTSSIEGHRAISATDDALYFCNNSGIGSLLLVAGATFDPTDSATYTYNGTALALPAYDKATCLAQLGQNLLIGGIQNAIYPWNRVDTSFDYPLIVAENYIACIVSTNSNAFIFAGRRGIIYITNGANIDVFKKFPDSISNTIEPYYTWGWAIYLKNQLYFSLSVTDNSSTTISNYAGIWAIDLTTEVLRMSNSLSYGTYAGTVPVLVPMGHIFPTGDGIYAGWLNSTGGVDYTAATPYTNYEATIDSDLIPVGTFLNLATFTNIEFKLGKPLVSGEQVKLSWRSNLTDSFTEIGSTTTVGALSDKYDMNFEKVQWLQIRASYNSTDTTPSYTLLREIRIRR